MNCKKHPKYKANKPPTGNCRECLSIWQAAIYTDPSVLIKVMRRNHKTLEQLGINPRIVRHLKDIGYTIEGQRGHDGVEVFYITEGAELTSMFFSGLPKKGTIEEVRFVELSDIHFASKQHDEAGFRYVMDVARAEGYTRAHISGDIVDGVNVYRGHAKNLRYHMQKEQEDYAIEVLGDYDDFDFYSITGNHDLSFVNSGGKNPLYALQEQLRSFHFMDSPAADMIICGVAFRMVHIDGMRAYARSYPAQTYIRNLFASNGQHVRVAGNDYRIKGLQVGHLHFEISFSEAGMHVTHPGNFQRPNDYTTRRGLVGPQGARLTSMKIDHTGHIMDYNSRFIEPRR